MMTLNELDNYISSSLSVRDGLPDGEPLATLKAIVELENLIGKGIINGDSVREQIDMKKETLLKSVHPYKISQGTGKDDRWTTHVIDPDTGELIRMKRRNKTDLIDALIKHYCLEDAVKRKRRKRNPTLPDVYEDWLAFRMDRANRATTVHRLETDYIRFFVKEKDGISQKVMTTPLSKLTTNDWERWACSLIKKYSMTSTAYNNVAGIVRSVYKYLIRENILTTNPFLSVEIQRNSFRRPHNTEALTQVYDHEEKDTVITEACRLAVDTLDENYYAIPMGFWTGLRPAEVLGLKFSDFDFSKNRVCVSRSLARVDTRDAFGKWTTSYSIEEYLKQNAPVRYVDIDPSIVDLLNAIKKVKLEKGTMSEFLFDVVTPNNINMKLYDICDHHDLLRRSAHKLRKTYGSDLLNGGVDSEKVKSQLGHSDVKTTLAYYNYATTPSAELQEKMIAAIGSNRANEYLRVPPSDPNKKRRKSS